MTYRICFAGAPQTGKSTLAGKLLSDLILADKTAKLTVETKLQNYDNLFEGIDQYSTELKLMKAFSDQFADRKTQTFYPFQGSDPTQYQFLISENSLLELISYAKTSPLIKKEFISIWEKSILSVVANMWDLIVYLPEKTQVRTDADYRSFIDRDLKLYLKKLESENFNLKVLELNSLGFQLELAEIKQYLINEKKL